MQITIFGASGKVGSLIVSEALERGHSVTVFAHSKSNFPSSRKLRVVKGSIYETTSVADALKGSNAVISALGSWGSPRKDVLESAMKSIIPAMQASSISRIVSLTGADTSVHGDVFNPIHGFSRIMLSIVARKILRDGERHAALLKSSDLDWTVLRSPAMIEYGDPLKYRLTKRRPLPWATIHRRSVALCMVDLLESSDFVGQAPFITRS